MEDAALVLFLEDVFDTELAAVGEQFVKRGLEALEGGRTLREIPSFGNGHLEFFQQNYRDGCVV